MPSCLSSHPPSLTMRAHIINQLFGQCSLPDPVGRSAMRLCSHSHPQNLVTEPQITMQDAGLGDEWLLCWQMRPCALPQHHDLLTFPAQRVLQTFKAIHFCCRFLRATSACTSHLVSPTPWFSLLDKQDFPIADEVAGISNLNQPHFHTGLPAHFACYYI